MSRCAATGSDASCDSGNVGLVLEEGSGCRAGLLAGGTSSAASAFVLAASEVLPCKKPTLHLHRLLCRSFRRQTQKTALGSNRSQTGLGMRRIFAEPPPGIVDIQSCAVLLAAESGCSARCGRGL